MSEIAGVPIFRPQNSLSCLNKLKAYFSRIKGAPFDPSIGISKYLLVLLQIGAAGIRAPFGRCVKGALIPDTCQKINCFNISLL